MTGLSRDSTDGVVAVPSVIPATRQTGVRSETSHIIHRRNRGLASHLLLQQCRPGPLLSGWHFVCKQDITCP
jgi:hypothetical protein